MYNDLKLAFDALRQPFCQLVLAASFLATLVFFLGLARLTGWLIADGDLIGTGWLETLASFTGGFVVLVIGWFLFPVVMTAISCLFLEQLAERLERHYYPDMPEAKDTDWGDAVALTGKTLWRAMALNLIILPVYFIPVLNFAAYIMVNAALLAHEYFHALASRHMPLAQAESLYAQEKGKLFRIGMQLAILFLIPGLNLVAPILATSFMLHRLERRPDGLVRRALA